MRDQNIKKYRHYIHVWEKFYQLHATKQQLSESLKSQENGSFRKRKNLHNSKTADLVILSTLMIVISYGDVVVS